MKVVILARNILNSALAILFAFATPVLSVSICVQVPPSLEASITMVRAVNVPPEKVKSHEIATGNWKDCPGPGA